MLITKKVNGLAALALTLVAAAAPTAAFAQDEFPPTTARAPEVVAGTPAVVALGDSAMSGEAGRWAGNTNGSYTRIDALGPTAYDDVQGGESIPGCHRSKSAEVHIGVGWESANLACSGART